MNEQGMYLQLYIGQWTPVLVQIKEYCKNQTAVYTP